MKKDYDEIRIEDLEVFANHGVFPEENVLGQKFLVSAVLYTDTRRAGLTDDLSASIHYGEVSAYRPLLAGAYISIIGEGGRSACRRTFAAYSRTREDQTGDQETVGSGAPSAENGQRCDRAAMAYRIYCTWI